MQTSIWKRPLTVRSIFGALVDFTVLALVVYLTASGLGIARAGYAWSDMDWNGDGHTELGEVLRAGDIGRRPIVQAGQPCTEFFNLKDGLPVRVRCRERST